MREDPEGGGGGDHVVGYVDRNFLCMRSSGNSALRYHRGLYCQAGRVGSPAHAGGPDSAGFALPNPVTRATGTLITLIGGPALTVVVGLA